MIIIKIIQDYNTSYKAFYYNSFYGQICYVRFYTDIILSSTEDKLLEAYEEVPHTDLFLKIIKDYSKKILEKHNY